MTTLRHLDCGCGWGDLCDAPRNEAGAITAPCGCGEDPAHWTPASCRTDERTD